MPNIGLIETSTSALTSWGPKQLLNCISPGLFRKPLDSLLSIAKSKQLVSTPQVPTVANQHDFKASLPCSNTKSWPLKI